MYFTVVSFTTPVGYENLFLGKMMQDSKQQMQFDHKLKGFSNKRDGTTTLVLLDMSQTQLGQDINSASKVDTSLYGLWKEIKVVLVTSANAATIHAS